MELSHLKSFLKVAEEENITRAAYALFLTQPAVTQHIRTLEKELGVSLFDRTGRGVQLTPEGNALREYAKRGLSILDEGKQVIADLRAGAAGRLSLGAGVTTSIFNLPKWLNIFHEEFPKVDVVVLTGRSAEIIEHIMDREVDLGFVTSPTDHPNLCTVGLYDEEIVLVSPPGHPLTGRVVSPDELSNAPLIMFPPGAGFREFLDRTLPEAGFHASIKMQTDSVEAIKSFVAVGLGLSFLPSSAVEAEIEAGILARVEIENSEPIRRRTSIAYRTDRYLSRAAQGFLHILSNLYDFQPNG